MEIALETFKALEEFKEKAGLILSVSQDIKHQTKLNTTLVEKVQGQHLFRLIEIIFLKCEIENHSFPFIAAQLLEFISQNFPERFEDGELILQSFKLLDECFENFTSCGYFCQFLKPLVQKSQKSAELMIKTPNFVNTLFKSIRSLSISTLIQEAFKSFPNSCNLLLAGLLNTILFEDLPKSRTCSDILRTSLNCLTQTILDQVFNEESLNSLLNVSKERSEGLSVILELLSLDKTIKSKLQTLRIISENIEIFTSFLSQGTSQAILVLKIMKKSINSNFGIFNYLLGNSEFVQTASVCFIQELFLQNLWSSQLHLAFFDLISSIFSSRSNQLLLSVRKTQLFRTCLLEKLMESSLESQVKINEKCVRKGNFGFLTKIGILFRDFLPTESKNCLKWKNFLAFLDEQETRERKVLGGRPRLRTLAEEELNSYFCEEKKSLAEDLFFCARFWKVEAWDQVVLEEL